MKTQQTTEPQNRPKQNPKMKFIAFIFAAFLPGIPQMNSSSSLQPCNQQTDSTKFCIHLSFVSSTLLFYKYLQSLLYPRMLPAPLSWKQKQQNLMW
jgi:hypothetical protein